MKQQLKILHKIFLQDCVIAYDSMTGQILDDLSYVAKMS